jgi:hypothetical protein
MNTTRSFIPRTGAVQHYEKGLRRNFLKFSTSEARRGDHAMATPRGSRAPEDLL